MCVCVPDMPVHKVITDHFTHASGRQRGYINCLKHPNCFHWSFCDIHASRHDFFAFQLAWALMADETQDRDEHMGREPEQARVVAVRALLAVEDF